MATKVTRPSTNYTVGKQTFTQEQLNNSMPGNIANDIYRATHQGQTNTPVISGGNKKSTNPGSYVSQGKTKTNVSTQFSNVNSPKTTQTGSAPAPQQTYYEDNSGGGGYSEGGGGGGGGFDYAAMIAEMLAAQRRAAEEAYGRAKERLDSTWSDTLKSLESNKTDALGQLKTNYDYTSGMANDDANRSLKQAYINYMLNKKNINQNLSAMGVSGGASESSLANMYNNYGDSRNEINTTLSDNLAKLLNAYQNNVSNVNQTYNSQYSDARNNYMSQLNSLESALANNIAAQYSGGSLASLANYASTLSGLVNSMSNTGFTPTTNNLAVDSVSTSQGNGIVNNTSNYGRYLALVQSLRNSGVSDSEIITQLRNNGASLDDVYSLLGR